MIDLSSSWLKAVVWIKGNLQVQTKSGNNYVYLGVTQPTFNQLMRSKSKGRFFNRHIIPNHLCVKLEPTKKRRRK